MIEKVNERLKTVRNWLLPGSCLLCAARVQYGQDLCAACEQSLPRPAHACPHCAAAITSALSNSSCGECQQRPPAYAYARAVFTYASPVDRLVQALKYHNRLEHSRVLGNYLSACINALDDPRPDVIVPVPLHPSRLRVRGYNQSLELARGAARRFGIPHDYQHTRRVRATRPQMELPRDQRKKNVRGAFEADAVFAGQRVAIVDDVMTSGHTVNALSECLLTAGAEAVVVWVLARA